MAERTKSHYVYEQRSHHTIPLRNDLFGLANCTDAIRIFVVLALLATSNDYSIKALGTPQWKQLQRWNYAVFALVAIHIVAYQLVEKQKLTFVVVVAITITVAFQLAGLYLRRSRLVSVKKSPMREQ